MTIQDAQNHIDDIKEEISHKLFHEASLKREIELLKPQVESHIVKPRRITNLSQLTHKDIEVDVVPANLASMEVVQARKAYYYAIIDLANTRAEIAAKKELLVSYFSHIQQELKKKKVSSELSDDVIFDAFRRAQSIKDLTDEERASLKNISETIIKTVNTDSSKKREVLETLNKIISRHGT